MYNDHKTAHDRLNKMSTTRKVLIIVVMAILILGAAYTETLI